MTLLQSANKNNKWYALFCIIGFLLNFIAFYPGFLSPDGIDQYQQAISGQYNDWHPPIMAVLWSLLNKIYNGPAPMLFLQLTFLWVSSYLLMTSISYKVWSVVIGLLMFAPYIQNFSGYIIKDSQMAFSWLLAFSIMFWMVNKGRKLSVVGGIGICLLLLYGSMVRPNALPGVIPLCYLFVWIVSKNKNVVIKAAWTIGLFLLMAASQYVINNVIIKPEPAHAEDKLYLHDLTGVFIKTHKNVFPAEMYKIPGFDTGYLAKHYTPATFDDIWDNPDKVHVQVADTEESITPQLQAAWVKAIKAYPLVYLQNRYEGFLYYLRIKNRGEFNYTIRWMEDNKYGFVFRPNIVSNLFGSPIDVQKELPYMKPWFWFFLNFILLLFIPKVRNNFLKVGYSMLLYSSLLYALPCFFIFQTDTDFRYFYWNCIACSLAICLLVADKYKREDALV
jgi:hypothetical protein